MNRQGWRGLLAEEWSRVAALEHLEMGRQKSVENKSREVLSLRWFEMERITVPSWC